MSTQTRSAAWVACMAVAILAAPAGADDAATGYEASGYEIDVSHTGYPGGASNGNEATLEVTSPNYVVIEVEDGTPEDVGGQTVIVVQEPDPVAATEEAPPPVPKTVDVAQPTVQCASGIWVEGHWAYADGQYVWVDGHCVVERVNYVFVHPRWDFYSNVWWYVPGYFRPCRVWVGYGYYRPYHWFPPYHHAYYRGYRGVPVRRAPYRPTVARPVSRTRTPVTTNRIPTVGRSVPTRSDSVARVPTRSAGVSRVPATATRTVTRSTTGRAPVVRTSPPRSTSVARGTPTRTFPTRSVTARTGTVDRGSSGSRTRVGSVGRSSSSSGRSSTVTRSSSSRMRWGGGSSRPSTSPTRTNTVNRGPFGGSSFGRSNSMGRSMPSMRTGGFSRPTSVGGGARTAPISRGR